MTTSNPVTPEPGMSDHTTGHDGHGSPAENLQESEVKMPHDNGDDVTQSPSSTSGDSSDSDDDSDKLTEAPLTANADDSGVFSKNPNGAPADATDATDATEEAAAGTSDVPPLPSEPLPAAEDDGWDFHWDPAHQAWFFHNRITNESTWENPRVSAKPQASTEANTQLQTPPATAVPPLNEQLPAGGYNPAIHGDYDPNAWYAKSGNENDEPDAPVMDTATAYATIGSFNRFTGRWQGDEQGPDRHNDEAKSRRQMNAFFDVDAAANAHDGRSLKAERSGKKPSKTELKQFKEKRRAKKEEKRRAWLRD
ncbi:hypothetical protein E0Z10_g8438 [Xylaria hypoxylon]|uniref:WW domain-containing protein n=1 Tax=Xylaria hypoxylon TaxID=37992 RepID=A0A4Z0YJL3_9PEZI|nr:hypothetical protein E0Z10_g8438 [Xylaria hypoxylon]